MCNVSSVMSLPFSSASTAAHCLVPARLSVRPYGHGRNPEEAGRGPTYNQQINNGPLCSIICWAIQVYSSELQYAACSMEKTGNGTIHLGSHKRTLHVVFSIQLRSFVVRVLLKMDLLHQRHYYSCWFCVSPQSVC